MKHVICGDDTGYLISKKEFDEKLRQRFKELKDKHIASAGIYTSRGVGVRYFDKAIIKEENGLKDAISRFRGMNDIGIHELTKKSIVRDPIIAKIEERYENDGK